MDNETVSIVADTIPGIASAKSVGQLIEGKDLITGAETNRFAEAGGLVLGMVPAGKLGGKIIAGVAKDAAKKAEQIHHFATNKSKKYTAALSKIAEKYGLDLDGAWNKASLPHAGRHPNAYHEFVLDTMKQIDKGASGSQEKFLELYNIYVKEPVKRAPEMLRKEWWK